MGAIMKDRKELAQYFAQLGFKEGAEIGVLGGGYASVLCQAMPGLKLYCIDKWGLNERRYKEYHLRKYEEAKIRLAPYNCELIRKFSMDAVNDFEDYTLDFVYIDADHHYQNTLNDIREWAKKVKRGGVVSGHDYSNNNEVVGAVDDYVRSMGYKLFVTDSSNDGRKDDRQPSWYFRKGNV